MTVLASTFLEEKLSEKGQVSVLDFVVPMGKVCCYYIPSLVKVKLKDM
jgi:hypothetical protein